MTINNNNKNWVFISGAAGGLGEKAAELFHQQGYRLWLSDINQEALALLQNKYPDARLDNTDLTKLNELESLCHSIESHGEQIDFAYINAGISLPGRVIDTNRKAIALQLDINLKAATFLNHAVAKKMCSQKCGHIINTLSTAAMISLQEGAAYCASKFGLRGFLIALAAELKPYNVNLSCIYPNAIDTPMLRFEAMNGGSALNFLDPPITPDDIMNAIKKAQKSKKLEYFVPSKDSLLARLVCIFPGMLNRLYPLLNKMGEKGRAKYIKKNNLAN